MDAKQYVEEANRTKSDKFYPPNMNVTPGMAACSADMQLDVLHAIVGIATEGGELLDVAKKAMFYGKHVDYVNLDEEMGDVLWYIAIYCKARGIELEYFMAQNIAKLRVRFPANFTEHDANNRQLDSERETLQAHSDAVAKHGNAPDNVASSWPLRRMQPDDDMFKRMRPDGSKF